MDYDLDFVRSLFRSVGSRDATTGSVSTDGVDLTPIDNEPPKAQDHLDRLERAGLIIRTREILMKHHDAPVTYRATKSGREWVRRAHGSDAEWSESAHMLRKVLDAHV